MTRYLIKVTYAEGAYIGESYLLRKGGYVTEESSIHGEFDTYKSKKIAQHICNRMLEDNEINRKIERQDEEMRIKRGRAAKTFYIYTSCIYEPFAVEIG